MVIAVDFGYSCTTRSALISVPVGTHGNHGRSLPRGKGDRVQAGVCGVGVEELLVALIVDEVDAEAFARQAIGIAVRIVHDMESSLVDGPGRRIFVVGVSPNRALREPSIFCDRRS